MRYAEGKEVAREALGRHRATAQQKARRGAVWRGEKESLPRKISFAINSELFKVLRQLMAGRGGGGGVLPQTHKLAPDAARIEIIIKNDDPIELLDFTASLTGMAREHEARLRAERPGIDIDETRLLIVDVRKGSIILELVPALAPIIATAEVTNTALAFVDHMKILASALREPGGRAEAATTQQLKNMGDTVQAVARDSKGELTIVARHQDGTVLQEIVITRSDARQIAENATAQRKEIEDRGSAPYHKVLMRLHQSSVEALKVGKRTSDKGIVERIDETPRVLVYISDAAGQKIKDEILKSEGNPFQKGFIIDLDVETVAGKPRVYRVLDVHEVIDLDD